MPGFTLKKHPAKVAHVNPREEKHGEEPVLGCDIKISADVPNSFLTQLAPTLKSALYKAEGDEAGTQRPLIDDGTHLPVLMYPQLGDLAWDVKMVGARLILHGAKKVDDVEIVGEVNALKLAPKEGGTVAILFRCQTEPAPAQVAAVCALLGQQVKVSVLAGEAGAGEEE